MPRLNSEQQAVLGRILAIGRRVGATPKEIKAAVETGLVESNLSNPRGGDADSAGWRQERSSLYKDPTNLDASIHRFFSETAAVRDRYGNSGALAAAVQRPAAQYRGRYGQVAGEASALLGGGGGGGGGGGPASFPGARTTTTTTPGTDNSAARFNLVRAFLFNKSADPLSFVTQFKALADIPGTSRTTTIPGSAPAPTGSGTGVAGGSLAAFAQQRANVIDAQRLPYSWGGGHGGKTKLTDAVPLDCSGAVSKVLGIDPRVSGQFESWGKPGDSGDKGVTIAANPHHVLMKINGHWFGTSASNPGGGAGWIPQANITPGYLRGFTLRHA
jgi:hypothetical protein